MRALEFWKTETLGNDFVLVHEADVRGEAFSSLAQRLCRRRYSIGSDGLLIVGPREGGLALRMFNPDGTEDFCGNGLRCAGLHAHRQGWVDTEFTILHGDRHIPARVSSSGLVGVTLPPATFEPRSVPVASQDEFLDEVVAGVRGTAVSTGSTHFVALVRELPDDDAFFRVSPLIEHDPLFPDRTSVMYAVPEPGQRLRLRIWERGAGETLGCGTGSVAAAVVWARQEGRSGQFTVSNPGGELLVTLEDWKSPVLSESSPVETFHGALKIGEPVLSSQASLV